VPSTPKPLSRGFPKFYGDIQKLRKKYLSKALRSAHKEADRVLANKLKLAKVPHRGKMITLPEYFEPAGFTLPNNMRGYNSGVVVPEEAMYDENEDPWEVVMIYNNGIPAGNFKHYPVKIPKGILLDVHQELMDQRDAWKRAGGTKTNKGNPYNSSAQLKLFKEGKIIRSGRRPAKPATNFVTITVIDNHDRINKIFEKKVSDMILKRLGKYFV